MRRTLLNSIRIIKQKAFLTESIGSEEFENGMTEIQLNLANLFMLTLFYLEFYISKINLEKEEELQVSKVIYFRESTNVCLFP